MADSINELVGQVTANLEENFAKLSQALREKLAEVEDQSAQVKRKREELDEEKRAMSSLPLHSDPSAEIVEVNVGGEIFQTLRATLLAAEGSLLEAMFSGRWEKSLRRDKEGRVFLDFDPAHFRVLLNHLRLHSIAEPEKLEARPLMSQPDHKDLFEAMVDYLGMREFLYGRRGQVSAAALTLVKSGAADPNLTIDGQRVSLLQAARNGHRTVVGSAPLLDGGIRTSSIAWKVSVAKLSPGQHMAAGILGDGTPDPLSQVDSTSYMWGSLGHVFTAGAQCDNASNGVTLQEGDVAIFKLDQVGELLRLYLQRTGEIHDISLPDGFAARARLHLVLFVPGTEVVVSRVGDSEAAQIGF